MEARIKFFRISRCGYFHRGRHLLGSMNELFEDISQWLPGKTLNETSLYSPSEDAEDILRTFCYSVSTLRDQFLLVTWNESENVAGKVATIDTMGQTGNADVQGLDVRNGYTPGYPAFFWFIPDQNVFASIQFNTTLNGRKNLDVFLTNFLQKCGRYVIHDQNDLDTILGYGSSPEDAILLTPEFRSKEGHQSGKIEYIRDNYTKITKIKKKDKLLHSRADDVEAWQKIWRFVSGNSQNRNITFDRYINLEIKTTPSLIELNEIISTWENDRRDCRFADVGFKFCRDQKIYWLSHSLITDYVDLNIVFERSNILVPGLQLLEELQRKQDILFRLLSSNQNR